MILSNIIYFDRCVLIRGKVYNRHGPFRTNLDKRLAKIQELSADFGLFVESIRWCTKGDSVEDLMDLQGAIGH
jgi:hypothetical protein